MHKIIFYTKYGCHLCDEMKEVLKKVRSEIKFDLEEVNIENDNELFEKYKVKIPLLMINGKIFAKYRIDEAKLRKKIG